MSSKKRDKLEIVLEAGRELSMGQTAEMEDTYEERKVAHYEEVGYLGVDTALVTDSPHPYETAVCHVSYNDGNWIIVETYDTKEEAAQGHERWVATMTADELPDELRCVAADNVSVLKDELEGDTAWRVHRRK